MPFMFIEHVPLVFRQPSGASCDLRRPASPPQACVSEVHQRLCGVQAPGAPHQFTPHTLAPVVWAMVMLGDGVRACQDTTVRDILRAAASMAGRSVPSTGLGHGLGVRLPVGPMPA